MPAVSVIIPNYNHATFLKQRIDSVLNQTYQDFEVIILDDKSTDNSQEIIGQYASHEKIAHIIYNEVNSGSTFKQWQKGLQLVRGKYIWIAESDDYADDTLLETLMTPFNQHQDMIISYCQSAIVDDDGKFLHLSEWANPLNKTKWTSNYIESSSVELKDYLSFRNTIPNASGVVFAKPNDKNILNDSCNLKMAGDWIFWRKLLSKPGKIAFNAAPLNYFRLHLSTTRSSTYSEKEIIRHKEFKRLLVPALISFFNSKYDWMIISWWVHRHLLKGTRYYYIPDFPLKLLIRAYIFAGNRAMKKVYSKAKMVLYNHDRTS